MMLSFGSCSPPDWQGVRPDKETATWNLTAISLPWKTCLKLQIPCIRLYPPPLLSSPAPGSSLASGNYCPRLALSTRSMPHVILPWLSHPYSCCVSQSAALPTHVRARKHRKGTWPGTCASPNLPGNLSCLLDLSHLLGWHLPQVQAGSLVPRKCRCPVRRGGSYGLTWASAKAPFTQSLCHGHITYAPDGAMDAEVFMEAPLRRCHISWGFVQKSSREQRFHCP